MQQQQLSAGPDLRALSAGRLRIIVRRSGRLECKADEARLATECALLGPLLGGGVAKRARKGEKMTLPALVRAIADGSVRKELQVRESRYRQEDGMTPHLILVRRPLGLAIARHRCPAPLQGLQGRAAALGCVECSGLLHKLTLAVPQRLKERAGPGAAEECASLQRQNSERKAQLESRPSQQALSGEHASMGQATDSLPSVQRVQARLLR